MHVQPTQNTFDGLVIGPAGNGIQGPDSAEAAEGGARLDLSTLDEHDGLKARATAFGFTEEGRGVGKIWSVKDFGDGYVEVCGIHTQEGTRKRSSRNHNSKKRAVDASEVTEETKAASFRRSKKRVRHSIIMLKPTHMLTLTTRAAVVDLDDMRKMLSLTLADIRRNCPQMRYVAVFERHSSEKTSSLKEGSLHVHIAMRCDFGKPPYKEIWHYWRKAVAAVTRSDDYEGAQCHFDPVRSKYPVSVARYMAKYLTKELDNEHYEPNKRRYWVSTGIDAPKVTRLFSPPSIWDETFRAIWEEILGMEIRKVWIPDVIEGVPPVFWLSTG